MTDKNFQSSNALFKIGVVFVLFWSFLIGLLNIGIVYLFGVPVLGLLLGIIFVWISGESTKKKLILTFIPIPPVSASFFLFYLLLPKAEPEIFLIPDNFRGHIVVVFNEDCGSSSIYEDGRRIYDFSQNNIVITKSKSQLGVLNRQFYSLDKTGKRTEMPEFHWGNFEEEQKDWHWVFSGSNLSKNTVGVFWAYRNDYSFVISDYEFLEKQDMQARDETQKLFQTKLEAALINCRQ
jgi:hypothetical protein